MQTKCNNYTFVISRLPTPIMQIGRLSVLIVATLFTSTKKAASFQKQLALKIYLGAKTPAVPVMTTSSL
jgi:hypothetical protein